MIISSHIQIQTVLLKGSYLHHRPHVLSHFHLRGSTQLLLQTGDLPQQDLHLLLQQLLTSRDSSQHTVGFYLPIQASRWHHQVPEPCTFCAVAWSSSCCRCPVLEVHCSWLRAWLAVSQPTSASEANSCERAALICQSQEVCELHATRGRLYWCRQASLPERTERRSRPSPGPPCSPSETKSF